MTELILGAPKARGPLWQADLRKGAEGARDRALEKGGKHDAWEEGEARGDVASTKLCAEDGYMWQRGFGISSPTTGAISAVRRGNAAARGGRGSQSRRAVVRRQPPVCRRRRPGRAGLDITRSADRKVLKKRPRCLRTPASRPPAPRPSS